MRLSSGGGGVPVPGCVSGSLTFGPSAFQHGAQRHLSALGRQRLRPGVAVVRRDHGAVADADGAVAGASKHFDFTPVSEYQAQVLLMFTEGWSAENQRSRFTVILLKSSPCLHSRVKSANSKVFMQL